MNQNIFKILLRIITLSAALGALLYIWFFLDMDTVRSFDLTAFLNGANIIKNGSGNLLYDIGTQKRLLFDLVNKETPIVFKNPPTLALFYIPFTFLSFDLSYKLIASLLLAIAFLSSKLMSGLFGNINKDLVLFATILFIPGLLSVLTGQLSYLILIVWVLIIRYLAKKKDLEVGVLTGLLFNKPQYLLIAPFLLMFVADRKKYLIGLLSVLFIHVLISGYLIGFNNLPTYFYFLKDTELYIYGSDPYSQISLSALLFNIFKFLNILRGREYIINLVFYLAALFYYKVSYSAENRLRLLFALPLLILFFSPHVWDYDLVIALPSFFYLLSFSKKQNLKLKPGPLFAAILLYFGWNIRFIGFPFLTSLILLFGVFYIINQQTPAIFTTLYAPKNNTRLKSR